MDCGVQPQVIAVVGINHGGSVDEVMRLMDLAQLSGADMVATVLQPLMNSSQLRNLLRII